MFVGDDKEIAALPPAPVEAARRNWVAPAVVAGIVLVVLVLMLVRC
jgi:hypothetical protein